MSSLLQDVSDRGLDKDVTVVMWGEFGRTPRVNGGLGRDHRSRVAMGFLVGGGMRLGQAIGTTTANAEEAKDRPVQLLKVFTTLYHKLGIETVKQQLIDPAGRPQYLVGDHEPIRELI